MKVRVVLMTENDKHLDEIKKDDIEKMAKLAWDIFCITRSKDGDTCICESIELVEN